jgi:ABC-type phosphate/phosphonate transport system permease subunit
MEEIFFSPPVAFLLIFFVVSALAWFGSRCAFHKDKESSGTTKAYACGEDFQDHLIQPDYSQFFPFAFFFTILHVVALVIGTVPTETLETFAMAVVYVAGAIIGLLILLRK